MTGTVTHIDTIKDRCHIDTITGCWMWRGAVSLSNGGSTRQPRVWTVDYTRDATGNTKTVQTGNRAAWHAHTGQPIPPGHRVFKTSACTNGMCVNPAHMQCGTTTSWGKSVARKGVWKGSSARIQANRATGRARSHVDAATVADIRNSTETGEAIAARLGIGRSIVSKARRGQMKSMLAGNPFAGLMA